MDDLLNPRRLDAAVLDELLHGELGHVAAGEIVAGDDDDAGRVIDDDVHAGGCLEGVDVAALLADDLALHVVGRELHHRGRGFRSHLGGVALHRLGHEVLGHLLGLLLDLRLHQLDLRGVVAGELFLELVVESLLGLLGAQLGHLLQCGAVLCLGRTQLILEVLHLSLLLLEVAALALHLLYLLIQGLFLLLKTGLLFLQTGLKLVGAELCVGEDLLGRGLGLSLRGADLGPGF